MKEITPSVAQFRLGSDERLEPSAEPKTKTKISTRRSLEEMIDENIPDLNSNKKDTIIRSIREFESSDFGKNYKFEKIPENSQSRMMKEYKGYSDKVQKDNSLSFSNYFEKRLESSKKSKKGGSLLKLLMIGGLNTDDEEEQNENEENEEFSTRDENRTEDDIIIEEPDLPDIEEEIENMTTDNYKIDVANFMRNLRNNTTKFLSMTPNEEEPSGLPPLMKYSPKYVEIIKNLTSEEHVGLHLLYSQFRNMEGIDIFSMALNVNGFKRFRLIKNSSGGYEVSSDALEGYDLCYAMYTGESTIGPMLVNPRMDPDTNVTLVSLFTS